MIIGVLCGFHSLLLSTTIIIGLKFVVHQVKFLDLRCSHFPEPLAVSINRKAFCNVHAKLFLRVPIIFSSHLSRLTWAWCYCRYRWFYQIAVKELYLCDLFESMILVHLQMEEVTVSKWLALIILTPSSHKVALLDGHSKFWLPPVS